MGPENLRKIGHLKPNKVIKKDVIKQSKVRTTTSRETSIKKNLDLWQPVSLSPDQMLVIKAAVQMRHSVHGQAVARVYT